jgi:MoaA/NifB/PqqE/SkfB family radical SAM enzyme
MERANERTIGLGEALSRFGVKALPESGLTDGVGEIYVMLTYDCNLRCRMCPLWGERGFCRPAGGTGGAETLTADDIVRFVREARAFRPRTVTLSGGEPLLSPLFLPVVRALDELGMEVDVTTNGTLLSTLEAEDIARLHQVNLSLDGPPLVLREMGRGGEATLDKALAGMKKVLAARDARGRPGLRLLSVMTPAGVGRLESMLELFAAGGVEFDSLLLQHQLFMDESTCLRHEQALSAVHGTEGVAIWRGLIDSAGSMPVDRLSEEIARIVARYRSVMVSPRLSIADSNQYYGDGSWVAPHLASYCLAPWVNVMLGPQGDVWLCPGFPVGNVHEESFEAIYNGARARKLRQHIARNGVFPGCRSCWHLDNYR